MRVIADIGPIYALMDRDDSWHGKVKGVIEEKRLELILPSTILPEICYLANKYLGVEAEIGFVRAVAEGEIKVEEVDIKDYRSALKHMETYKELNIGFVDATVIAVAERLETYALLTTDRRHFSQIKTGKGKSFNLLP
ncbi:MAG: type II toxin-antitoxin system VapC family toxin [Thermodesulfobacteriota bacterium]